MKMIMTQAELAQFGRLRADMPRAPGPSTGAKPRQRIGFGSEANTGLGARPKVPSKLGLHTLQPQQPPQQQQIPKKSHSWYGTSPSRRFEEMELGGSLEEQPNGERDMEDEDEDNEDCEDCEEQELEDDEEDGEDGEEEEENYWTALRKTNNRSQRGLTRSTSSIELRQPHDRLDYSETTARSLAYQYQQHAIVDKQGASLYYHQQQQQHKRLLYPLAIPLQTLPHQQSLYSSSPNNANNIHSLTLGKSKNARRRAGVPSSTGTMSSLPSSSIQRRSSNSNLSSSSSLSAMPASSSHSSWSSTWSFFAPESFGFSGLLMLSLFFCILYLFEGTTHYYYLQSALLSIIL
ncbi:hypothetical protein BGZ70_010437 [Mortierella alpina]|uniref:Uncharacterized protein n=1 Tax=Mortierella alpina TaxID=64518 RepID=A0A9P6J162_MORAP|nr:hypothetical protein BGZ70_010437 [Mortierella alpina]